MKNGRRSICEWDNNVFYDSKNVRVTIWKVKIRDQEKEKKDRQWRDATTTATATATRRREFRNTNFEIREYEILNTCTAAQSCFRKRRSGSIPRTKQFSLSVRTYDNENRLRLEEHFETEKELGLIKNDKRSLLKLNINLSFFSAFFLSRVIGHYLIIGKSKKSQLGALGCMLKGELIKGDPNFPSYIFRGNIFRDSILPR